MSTSNPIRIAVAALAGAACLAPCAVAAPVSPAGQGEAKNLTPFTAPYAASRSGVRYTTSTPQTPVPQGEAKNGAPFDATYSEDPGLAPAYAKIARLEAASEAKNTPAFTDSAGFPRSGFNWIDASIGALVALGACLLVAGAVALRRHASVALRTVRVEHA